MKTTQLGSFALLGLLAFAPAAQAYEPSGGSGASHADRAPVRTPARGWERVRLLRPLMRQVRALRVVRLRREVVRAEQAYDETVTLHGALGEDTSDLASGEIEYNRDARRAPVKVAITKARIELADKRLELRQAVAHYRRVGGTTVADRGVDSSKVTRIPRHLGIHILRNASIGLAGAGGLGGVLGLMVGAMNGGRDVTWADDLSPGLWLGAKIGMAVGGAVGAASALTGPAAYRELVDQDDSARIDAVRPERFHGMALDDTSRDGHGKRASDSAK